MEIENNTELGEQFLDCVLANNYDAAYDMVKGAGDAESFQVYWDGIRELAEGASSYELEQIGWNVTVKNGVKTSAKATVFLCHLCISFRMDCIVIV